MYTKQPSTVIYKILREYENEWGVTDIDESTIVPDDMKVLQFYIGPTELYSFSGSIACLNAAMMMNDKLAEYVYYQCLDTYDELLCDVEQWPEHVPQNAQELVEQYQELMFSNGLT